MKMTKPGRSMFFLVLCAVLIAAAVGCGPKEPAESPVAARVSLDKQTIALDLYDTYRLVATKENTDEAIVWTSSDEAVATVTDGTVTACAVGQATITASAGGAYATCTVGVSDSQTAPVLLVEDRILVGQGGSYTLFVRTKWKGGEPTEPVTYVWSPEGDETDGITTLAVADNGAKATFSGVSAGEAVWTVSATVLGIPLAAEVHVVVRDVGVVFDLPALPKHGNVFAASVALKSVDSHSTVLDTGLTVTDKGAPVPADSVTYTYFDNDAPVGAAASEIIDFENGVITAKKFGKTLVVGAYGGNDFALEVTTYRPSIGIDVHDGDKDYITIETKGSDGIGNATVSVSLPALGGETIEGVLVNGYSALKGASCEGDLYTIVLDEKKLPVKAEELGFQTITIQTGAAEYTADAFLVTMIINDGAELNKLGSVAKTDRVGVYDGWFVLGNDIKCSGTYPVFYNWYHMHDYGISWSDAKNNGFRGVFDGLGHNIDGLKMPGGTANNASGSLLGTLNVDGVIRNVSFTHAEVGSSTGLLVAAGGGRIENVYIQCDSQAGAYGGTNSGFLFSNLVSAEARASHIIIETAAAKETQGAFAIGGSLPGTPIYDGVYAVAAIPAMNDKSNGAGAYAEDTSENGFAGFESFGAFAAAGIDFSSWDDGEDGFWAVSPGGGIPYPRNLGAAAFGPQSGDALATEDEGTTKPAGSSFTVGFADKAVGAELSVEPAAEGVTLSVTADGATISIAADVEDGTVISLKVFNVFDKTICKTLFYTVVAGKAVAADLSDPEKLAIAPRGAVPDGNDGARTVTVV